MTLSQYRDNWNYMHEWTHNSQWYPCHIYYDNYYQVDDENIYICTRNCTIMCVSRKYVRKMSEETYVTQRNQCMSVLVKYHELHGFHETLEEDLKVFRKIDEYGFFLEDIAMEIKTDIANLKYELETHKNMLDIAFKHNCYSGITEEAEKIVKLSYALNYLENKTSGNN